jgi:hypothetical protein
MCKEVVLASFKLLCRELLTEKNKTIHLMLAGATSEIRTQCLPNRS